MKAGPKILAEDAGSGRARDPDSPRERARRRTRDSLVEAAISCFAERGYVGTTVERIVERAETTPPTFYRYFTGKSDLLGPLQDHIGGQVSSVIEQIDRAEPRSREEMRAWVWTYQGMWSRLRQLCAAYWEAVAADPLFASGVMPRLLTSSGGMERILSSVAPEYREKMSLRLALLIVLLDRTVHLAGADLDETRAAAMINEFADMMWLSLYSSDARRQMIAQD